MLQHPAVEGEGSSVVKSLLAKEYHRPQLRGCVKLRVECAEAIEHVSCLKVTISLTLTILILEAGGVFKNRT